MDSTSGSGSAILPSGVSEASDNLASASDLQTQIASEREGLSDKIERNRAELVAGYTAVQIKY